MSAPKTDGQAVIKPSVLAVLAAALLACACVPAFARADGDDAIRSIEQGLRPAVALEGKPVPTTPLIEEMRRLHVPGVSIAVIRDGKIAWARGYGVATKDGPAVTPETLFQAASISKPVTALAALRMVEAHQLSLDADINTALTSWKLPPGPGGAHATLRQLLSHTAGTTVHGFPGYAQNVPVPTLVQVLDGAPPANTSPVRIDSPPGTAWNYSGGGYIVVQQAMIDRGGKPFADLLAETVLAPLGMKDSSFAQPLPAALASRAAMPHDGKGEPYPGGAYTYPELAAAGLWATPSDLARFILGVQRNADEKGQALLSHAMMRTMLQPVKNGYALGFGNEGSGPSRSFGHGGSNMGYQDLLFAYLEHGDGLVVMTNGEGGNDLAQGILRAAAFAYHWPSNQTTSRKAVALSPARRKALTGKYDIQGLGSFDILDQDGQLMISLREGGIEPLYAASPTKLFLLSRGIELGMAKDGSPAGRLRSGSFDVPFKPAGKAAKH
jgi:CubicO group peptidase (beta-lactamase class C family)